MLYFYPMDGTPVCTKEACSFRDAYEEFARLGAVVIGVSADSLERHRAFAASRLPFLLLSDQDGCCGRPTRCRRPWHLAWPGDLRDRQVGHRPARLQRPVLGGAACGRSFGGRAWADP